MIARRPRAPVPRSSALSAIACDGLVGELELDAVELEELLVLLDQRVAGLGEDLHQRLDWSSLLTLAISGSRPMNSGIRPNLVRSSGRTWASRSSASRSAGAADLGGEAEGLLADPLLDDVLEPGEGAAHDEQDVGGVDLDELLVRVLAAALRRHRGGGALDDLQQRLLHALAGDVARDRGVLRLAGHLVDLVDVDDPGLGLLDVVVGGLDQLEQDVLDVLADVARPRSARWRRRSRTGR